MARAEPELFIAARRLSEADTALERATERHAGADLAARALEEIETGWKQRLSDAREAARTAAFRTVSAADRWKAVEHLNTVLHEVTEEQTKNAHRVRCEVGTARSELDKARYAAEVARTRYLALVDDD